MILLDAPYVSEFLKKTTENLKQSVLDTPVARSFGVGVDINFIDESDFASRLQSGERVYTNSENSLDVIIRAAGDSSLARQIEVCKDKALFRETIASLYPEFRFARVAPDDLAELDISTLPCPFVIKPTRGFFSLGVHMVFEIDQWPVVIKSIKAEQAVLNAEYPEEVVDSGEFIIEETIEGEEYAIDVYYDENGEPTITNILYHQFASENDVSDRLYYTSTEILETWIGPFTKVATEIGRVCDFHDFPLHLEVRVDEKGSIIPIEANPLRFAGWGVCDITSHAWGFNPYEYYFKNLRPDWSTILKKRAGMVFAMVIGDVPLQVERQQISFIDFDGFCAQFEKVLEVRRIDHKAYPLFAIVFVQTTNENLNSLKSILSADFRPFITMKR